MFGINGGEFLVILLVAVIVVGPARLPHYAEQLARLTKQARRLIRDARSRVDEELGEEVRDIDWEALDPRRYDPRRIVRDALMETEPPRRTSPGTIHRPTAAGAAAGPISGSTPRRSTASDGEMWTAPFDDEAT